MDIKTDSYLLFLLLLPLCWGQRPDDDRERPSCSRCDLQLFCNCASSRFIHIPEVLEEALGLDLSFNNISEVTAEDLVGHVPLKTLSLHGNRLTVIHPSAFDSLWSLEKLDLSDNQLTSLNQSWFNKLEALQQLNLLNNPYSCLGSPPVFQGLVSLRRLHFGGPDLKDIRRGDLSGVTELEELTIHANNLERYESGALADMWPIGHVTLSLHGPVLTKKAVASAVLADVTYPNTPIVLEDLHLVGNESVLCFKESAKRRIRSLSLKNLTISDKAFVDFLVLMDGSPTSFLSLDDVTLIGEGRWERANRTDHRGIDEFFLRNFVVMDFFGFVEFSQYVFLFQYPRKVSVIKSKVFEIPCPSLRRLVNMQYLDLSDNQLTDLTLGETLCNGDSTLKNLRVLNMSGNVLKSLSTMSQQVAKLPKLTHLDISRNGYIFMPQSCSWPHTLRYLNLSATKLTTITNCLPKTLEVLDLSDNGLKSFSLPLPALRVLYLSGNKFLRLPQGHLFPNMQTLTIQSNTLNMFGLWDLQSYRRLQSLQAGQNKLVCSCDFVYFLQSSFKGSLDVPLTDAVESYICDSPLYLQGTPVYQVSLSIAECQQVLVVSLSCGVVLCFVLMVCFLLWRLHAFWYLKMIWMWIKAKRSSKCRQERDRLCTEALVSFDAFVSYSERDAGWVENYLVPELEGSRENHEDSSNSSQPRPLTLCLHKRDFRPGRWIMDNIMSAIESSRRTIFVLSENFVQSDWCRYELDFSHFWLFDGGAGREAAILILLGPLSKDDVPKRFCRLRKLMSTTTYLEWPQEEERIGEFWRNLRKALRVDEEDN